MVADPHRTPRPALASRLPAPSAPAGARALAALLAFGSAALLAGCLVSGKEDKVPRRDANAGAAEARLTLRTVALGGSSAPPARIDSIAVRVTGEGMEPEEFAFGGDALVLDLAGLPPGPARLVSASLFREGRLLYRGEAVADLGKESRAEVALRCEPRFSRVVSRFHLPPSLPIQVADGWLVLEGPEGAYSGRLDRQGEFAAFRVEEVPGDARYDVTLTLLDGAGKPAYESRKSGLHLPLGQEVAWDLPLTPSEAGAGVVLELPEPRTATAGARFPAALRKPARAGEVVLTEFYAAPAAQDSGSEGEWWEIFNRTADTLALAGCRLSRDRGAGATRSFAFDTTHRIAPGEALTFGRAASPARHRYADFSLVNTASPLLLLCAGDSLLVDSLRYSSTASDSLAVAMREGYVSSVDADSLGGFGGKGAWCLTRLPPVGSASPGDIRDCP